MRFCFFFQAEDGIRDVAVTGVQTCALPICLLQAPRGTYRLIIGPVTREFIVRRGTVQYFGTPDLDAALDIEASHLVHPLPGPGQPQAITVLAHIGGTLRLPQLRLEAENACGCP